MEVVRYNVKNRTAYIVINRPEKRNALNDEVVDGLKNAFLKAESDPEVKVVILTGEGSSFCSGADLKYLQKLQNYSEEENQQDSTRLMKLFHQIYTFPKPVIAQVNGAALAGGCGLVTVCDFAFSTVEAKFGYTEVRIGFIPAIVMVYLIRKVGEARARKLLVSGELIDCDQAERIGLLNGVYEEEDLENAVTEFAQTLISQNSGEAMSLTKEMITKVQDMSIEDALEYAVKMNAKARSTEDCKKGIAAFLNKEKIEW
jgi:methylglutaconyl-CoA hydratase